MSDTSSGSLTPEQQAEKHALKEWLYERRQPGIPFVLEQLRRQRDDLDRLIARLESSLQDSG